MLFCLRCKAPQTDDSAKATKRFFENMKLRKRILATAATGANKPIEALLTADFRHLEEAWPNERGSSHHSRRKGPEDQGW